MSSTYREIWKKLAEVSQPWRNLISRPSQATPTPAPSHAFPPLSLEVPPDLTAFLHDILLPPPTLQKALDRVQKAVDDQKALHERKYQETCNKFLQLNVPSSSFQHTAYYDGIKKSHERSFQRQLLQIQESVRTVYEQICAQIPQPKKPVFNAEYTPVLEQYFEYNAYPSSRDRELLARKSSMSPRQIEVWFQNHRRRARQEGRSLKRISTDPLPTNISLKTLKEKMPAFMIRKEERRSPPLEKDAPTEPIQRPPSPTPTPAPLVPEFSLDDIPSSSSAWPAAYCARNGVTFSSTPCPLDFESPVWYRKAHSASSPRSSLPLPINDLCSDLRSKLHIGGARLIRKQRDYKYLARSVATRRRYAIGPHPAPSTSNSTTRKHVYSEPCIKFGSTSICSRKRHQPYDLSCRKHPNWSLDKPCKSPSTPSRPTTPHQKRSSSIPRTPSLSSISSSGSSYCSDPPTPRDSPSSSFMQLLPKVSETLGGGAVYDPYAFDFSTDAVTSSYPSSTERYTSYPKPLHLRSLSTTTSHSRSAAY